MALVRFAQNSDALLACLLGEAFNIFDITFPVRIYDLHKNLDSFECEFFGSTVCWLKYLVWRGHRISESKSKENSPLTSVYSTICEPSCELLYYRTQVNSSSGFPEHLSSSQAEINIGFMYVMKALTFVVGEPAISFSKNTGIPSGPKAGVAFKQELCRRRISGDF